MSGSRRSVVYVKFTGPRRGEQGRSFDSAKDGDESRRLRCEGAEREDELAPEQNGGGGRSTAGLTMSATFSWREVSKLFELTEGRLRYWDKSGFIQPTGHNGARRCFTFQDLISVRSAKDLLDQGISLQRARKIIKQLQEKLPKASQPLSKLRILSDARTVVVADEDHEFEVHSGQLIMDFSVESIQESIVSQLPSHREEPEDRTAYEWYLEGCRLDEIEDMLDLAEEAYHRAIYLDPTLANAYTNLGNLRYRAGAVKDAKTLYLKAIEVDCNQPEAHYNLGFLEFEDGDLKGAWKCFELAVELDPTFADAHFNLAMTLFRLNEEELARGHWRKYLSLEPTGPWADIARRRLHEVN